VSGFRRERVADLVRQALSSLIREELRDPQLGFVTITEVDVSPDLKHARVYISTLEGDDSSIDALTRAAPFLRRGLARHAQLRFTPELRFDRDGARTQAIRVEQILDELDISPETEAASEGEEPGEQ
jgi:ribosome-binding factor A